MEPHFGLKSQEEVRLWMTPLTVTQQPCLLCASAFSYAKRDEIVQLGVELLWWTVSLIFKGDLFIFLMNYVCMCVSMWVYAITNMCTLGVWKRMVDLLELELKVVVSHLIGVLGIELGSSVWAVRAFDHWAISPDPQAWVWIPRSSCWHADSGSVTPWGGSWYLILQTYTRPPWCCSDHLWAGVRQPHSVGLIRNIWWQWMNFLVVATVFPGEPICEF